MEYGAFHAKEPELIQEAREAIQYIKYADENEEENRIKLCNLRHLSYSRKSSEQLFLEWVQWGQTRLIIMII
jgi:hypothetical protein